MSLFQLSRKFILIGVAIPISFLLSIENARSVIYTTAENPERKEVTKTKKLDASLQLLAQNTEQQRKTALVIGNANYQNGRLNNPVNDANDMAAALEELGFDVIKLVDADLRQIEEAVEQLSNKLQQGGVGLFYYAGHGVQVNGENYLIPLQASINRSQDVPYEAFPVGKLLGMMEDADNDVNIAILDACRDNPYARKWRSAQQGLAVMQSATGTLVAYATEPGGLTEDGGGRNGTYTSHLLQHIRTPNLDVELMFKRVRQAVIQETNRGQIPWESSSLIGSFAFNSQDVETTPVVDTVPEANNNSNTNTTNRSSSESNNDSAVDSNSVAYNSNSNYVLYRNIEGHSGWVDSVAVSPDGRRIVSGSGDKTIKVWNLATGKLERTLNGHSSSVGGVAVSPDGRRIVSGSGDLFSSNDDSTIRVWNLATGELERTLNGHSGSVDSVAVSPDGQNIISGSGDGTIRVWNLATGELERTLEGHSAWVRSVAISPDGQNIISGSSHDSTIRVWDLVTGELERTLEGHNRSVFSVAISPDGRRIVSGGGDKTIKVWNLATGELERTLEGHDKSVGSVTMSPDGQRIVSGSSDNTVKVWNLATGELERILEGHDKSVVSIAISPDGQSIVSGGWRTVKVWQLAAQ